jgi:hypothetical protein
VDWVNANDFVSVWADEPTCNKFSYKENADMFKGMWFDVIISLACKYVGRLYRQMRLENARRGHQRGLVLSVLLQYGEMRGVHLLGQRVLPQELQRGGTRQHRHARRRLRVPQVISVSDVHYCVDCKYTTKWRIIENMIKKWLCF